MAVITAFEGSVPYNYDRYLGPHLFEPYALDLVQRLDVTAPKAVLEIAAGTGRLTQRLLPALPPGAQLWATDLNVDMLHIAKQKTGDARVQWQVADAQALPFNDGQFDLVICQFGVMFFADKVKAFGEVHRVLQPGGRFLFNSWDNVEANDASNSTQKALNNFFAADAPQFMDKGPFSFFDQDNIRQLLQQAGFQNIRISIVKKQTSPAAADDIINGMVDGSPLTGYLKERGASSEVIKEAIRKQFAADSASPALPLSMQAIVVDVTK